jgi:hypothetical protein
MTVFLIETDYKNKKVKENSYSKFAAFLFFPFTLLSMVFIDQNELLLVKLGQLFGWISYIASFFLLLVNSQNKYLGLAFIISLLFFKVLQLAIPHFRIGYFLYIVFQSVLYSYAGMITVLRYGKLLFNQAFLFLFLNVTIMILQITGVGGIYTQMLTTHGTSDSVISDTLFVNVLELEYNIIQGRPAGLMDANVLLSMYGLFMIGFYFSSYYFLSVRRSIFISVFIVLTMAKIAMIGLVIALLFLLLVGRNDQRFHILFSLFCFSIFVSFYYFLFPGLSSYTLSEFSFSASFFLRMNEIASILFNGSKFGNGPFFEGTSYGYWVEEDELLSGVSALLILFTKYKVLVLLFLFVVYFYFTTFNRLRLSYSSTASGSLLVLLIVGLFSFTHPIWTRPLFWSMLGFGFLPIFYRFSPKIRRLVKDKNNLIN